MHLDRLDKCWFAIQVRPRYEFLAARVLRNKGFEELVPTYKRNSEQLDFKKQSELPLFPGYVFCRFDAQIHVPILTTPGVIRIVGGANAAIPYDEIEAIQAIVAHRVPANPCVYLKAGTPVQVIAGPLAGFQGFLMSYRNQYRLILSITMLQNSISVEVARGSVVPMEASSQPWSAAMPKGPM